MRSGNERLLINLKSKIFSCIFSSIFIMECLHKITDNEFLLLIILLGSMSVHTEVSYYLYGKKKLDFHIVHGVGRLIIQSLVLEAMEYLNIKLIKKHIPGTWIHYCLPSPQLSGY